MRWKFVTVTHVASWTIMPLNKEFLTTSSASRKNLAIKHINNLINGVECKRQSNKIFPGLFISVVALIQSEISHVESRIDARITLFLERTNAYVINLPIDSSINSTFNMQDLTLYIEATTLMKSLSNRVQHIDPDLYEQYQAFNSPKSSFSKPGRAIGPTRAHLLESTIPLS